MKIGWVIFISFLVGLAVWAYMEYCYVPSEVVTIKPRQGYNVVLLRLPTSHDPDKFGNDFWKARHKLAELTPCPACRIEAVSHEKFFHDYVNSKTEKTFFDKNNYKMWVKKINDQNNKS